MHSWNVSHSLRKMRHRYCLPTFALKLENTIRCYQSRLSYFRCRMHSNVVTQRATIVSVATKKKINTDHFIQCTLVRRHENKNHCINGAEKKMNVILVQFLAMKSNPISRYHHYFPSYPIISTKFALAWHGRNHIFRFWYIFMETWMHCFQNNDISNGTSIMARPIDVFFSCSHGRKCDVNQIDAYKRATSYRIGS